MDKSKTAWIVLADSVRCRLLQASIAPLDRCHVDQIDQIELSWEGHEHGRPSPLSGKSGNSHASGGHEAEEDLQRGARKAMAWLDQQAQDRGIDHMALFAEPRCMGALRKSCPARLTQQIQEKQANLAGFDTTALSKHPAIRTLVGLATG